MSRRFDTALQVGAGRVAGWADLLDQINVFPVSDGDTGRNLVLTFSPLLRSDGDCHNLGERVLLSARGNSGNIAAQFLSGFLEATERADLPLAVARGRDLAWQAVPNPRAGTMLSSILSGSSFCGRSTSSMSSPLRTSSSTVATSFRRLKKLSWLRSNSSQSVRFDRSSLRRRIN